MRWRMGELFKHLMECKHAISDASKAGIVMRWTTRLTNKKGIKKGIDDEDDNDDDDDDDDNNNNNNNKFKQIQTDSNRFK